MYATVRRIEGVTDPSEVRRQVEEGFVPIISQMPGFVAYYLVDAGDSVMVSTSVFEHQAAEEESTWRAGEFVAQHLAALIPNPPQITAGEVVAHKSTETAQSAQPESRAEEERPAREEPERDEGILDKAKRKLQGQ
jgi:hypothetical protein